MNELYNMIYKRKSIRKFDSSLSVSDEELELIKSQFEKVIPLIPEIKIKFEIVKKSETTAKYGEYALLFYSENKDNYLLNAGYVLEQMDLFMASINIGACWYGMAKPKSDFGSGLDYVIMLVFGKSKETDFRTDFSNCKRKSEAELFSGDFDKEILNLVRYAPSACNSQPWRASFDDNKIKIYRNTKVKSFIPFVNLPYYNSLDMGIFLCYLEIILNKHEYKLERTIINKNEKDSLGWIEIAEYKL